MKDLPPDYETAVSTVFKAGPNDKELYKMLTNPLLQNYNVITKVSKEAVKDDIYNRVISKDAMSKPESKEAGMLFIYDSYKDLKKMYENALVKAERDKNEI